MAYAHWSNNRHNDQATFELFFRKNPFGGEFTIFAGLDECLKHLANFKFTVSDVDYLKTVPALQHCDPAFFEWLLHLDTSQVTVRAMRDGTVAFPRVPLLVVQAPLVIGQLLETTLLTLVNYPSLIATNAARMVRAAHDRGPVAPDLPAQCSHTPACVEFGLRRAQGPDGGFSASKYSAVGGFDGTSNVQAGKLL
jgi:nicotinate phosphoribosyltransferase